MKYATWNLSFQNAIYGTGPEQSIAEQGFQASAGWSMGEVSEGAKVLGYFTGSPTGLDEWNFTEITQDQALEFAKAIDSTAYLTDEGLIGVIANRSASSK